MTMLNKTASLTIQKWGNSLAIRIPAAIARSAHFHLGMPVEVSEESGNVVVKPMAGQKMTLDERLAHFDAKKHGGEVMAVKPVGLEKF
jgi:antitoxin MazE